MEITLNNTFKNYEHFCLHLINNVFVNHNLNNELTKIEDIDWERDYLRRIFITTEDNHYSIRLWCVYDDENHVYVEYTIYQIDEVCDTVEIL